MPDQQPRVPEVTIEAAGIVRDLGVLVAAMNSATDKSPSLPPSALRVRTRGPAPSSSRVMKGTLNHMVQDQNNNSAGHRYE